ncbi:MinD/ParA family protein [Anaeromyxobacter paludicola]|uniref:MinD/ParA family protein n=1 Tax=Anaeromyxobacter paludicola TaxID=2918171 RepID=UPI0020C04CC8|nr:MinD/ParA family protein [Anaeromyxobacter paludicola]
MDQANTLRELVERSPQGANPLRVIAVTSGKGGVGKTHIVANLAVLAARMGRRVLLLDGDLGLANSDIVLGMTTQYHLGHLLDGTIDAEHVLAEGPHGIRVLGASSGVQELTVLDDAQKLRLLSALDPLDSKFDLVLIDCGAGIGDNVLFFAGAAQEAILVVSPEPTSLTDAYATVKVLSQRAGVDHFQVLVNPMPTEAHGREIFSKLSRVTDRFLQARLSFLGHIPRDENLQRALMAQRPVVDLYPRSPASRALEAICDRLLASRPQAQLQGGLKFLWQRLLRESGGPAAG